MAGQEHHRQRAAEAAQLSIGPVPIEFRHPHVQQDEPGLKQVGLRQKSVLSFQHCTSWPRLVSKMAGVGDGDVIVHQMN